MKLPIVAAASLGVVFGGQTSAGIGPFGDGDRICFLGDSITKQGGYHSQILLFYVTRFPDIRLTTWNCGIAGDTAAGGIKRYDWDVAPHRPTIVTAMMGINDVNRGLYARKTITDEIREKRQSAIDRNGSSLRQLAERVQRDGTKLILLTPSLYDQTGNQETECLSGVNDALERCADAVRDIAGQYPHVDVVEFNAPMAVINRTWQEKDPDFTVVGPDRVHPGQVGHLVMAYLFLKAQGVSGTVADIAVDAGNGSIVRQENCAVSSISVSDGIVAFDCLENALPFPVETADQKALELVPFTRDLNRETVCVTGLPSGDYEVLIDGQSVLRTTADALAKGIDLAIVPETPQYRQAGEVSRILMKRHSLETRLRAYALLKQQFFPDRSDAAPEVEEGILKAALEKLAGTSGVWNTYRRNMIVDYLKIAPEKENMLKQCDELLEKAYSLSKPVTHHYEFRRL